MIQAFLKTSNMRWAQATFAIALLGLLFQSLPVVAATGTWNSASSTDFNNTANWTWTFGSPNLTGPGLTDTLVFPTKGSLVDAVLTADAYAYRLDTSAATTWKLGALPSTQVLHLGAGGVSAQDSGWNCFRISLDADQLWNVSSGGAGITFSNALAGVGRMTKTGAGVLWLTGTNTGFSGGITLAAGTLKFGNADALGTGTFTFTGASALDNRTSSTITTPIQVSTPASITLTGSGAPTFSGPWTLETLFNYSGPAGGTTWIQSGAMAGSGALWTSPNASFGSSSAGTLTLNGTGKTFTGPILVTTASSSTPSSKSLEINTTTTPKAVYVMVPTLFSATAASPLQVGASGTLGSGRIEILAGGLITTAAGNLSGNASVYIGATPLEMGWLSVQYNGALPAFDAASVGVVALDAPYSTSIGSLGDMFLGSAINSSTFSGASLTAGNGSTYRLGGGGAKTLTINAASTTGPLIGANNLIVGRRGARSGDISRSAGINGANGIVSLNDDNAFSGSITVNNNSTLTAAKPATATSLSPLGANGTDKAVTLNGGELKVDNTTSGANGLAVGKGVLTVSGRGLLTVLASATKAATLTFDSLTFDSTYGGALFLADAATTLLGNKGVIKITNGQADTNLVSPRILGSSSADFMAYAAASGFINVTYVPKTTDFVPAGEIAKVSNGLAISTGTLQALHLTNSAAALTVTNSGTLNIASGGLSVDSENGSCTITNGTLHFGNSGDGTVEGYVGIKGGTASGAAPTRSLNLSTSLDGGAGVTFFSIYTGSGPVRGFGYPVYLDGAPVNQPIAGTMKILDNTTVGFKTTVTRNFGPTGVNPLFPNITTLLLNGGRFLLGEQSGNVTLTVGQNVVLGPHGGVFMVNESAQIGTLTLNGNLSGPGQLAFDGGEDSSVMNINGSDNSGLTGDVVIGGGTTTVAANSSLGTGNVQVKQGSGAMISTLILLGDANISSGKRLYVDDGRALNNMAYAKFKSASPEIGSLAGSGGNVVLGGDTSGQNTTLTLGNDNTDTFYAGVIADAAATQVGSVTKKGTGTFTLWNANTYTGPTTVNAGTLQVHGSTAAGSAVNVGANGTLGGLGIIGGVVTNSGTLAPGAGTVGTLTLNSNLVMQTGASLAWELGATTNDILAVKGSLTLGAGTTLKLYNAGYVGTLDGSYTLMTYTGADPSLGTWNIDYGTTGWSNGKVKLDNVSNPKRVYLTKGSTQGTMVLIF